MTTFIWGLLVLAGIFGIFAPSVFGVDGFNGGFAISFVSVIFALTAFVTTIMFAKRANSAEAILNGDTLLAHWHYTAEEWSAYTDKQFKADRSDKRNLFLLIAAFFAVAIVLMPIIDKDAGPLVALILLGIVGLIGLVAFLSIRADHARNTRSRGETYIGHDGVILNGVLYLWKGWGAHLNRVSIESGQVSMIIFEISAPSGFAMAHYTLRVPIPSGEESTARRIAAVTQAH